MAVTRPPRDRLLERRSGERGLRLQRAVLLAQQELSPDGILVVDRKGRIVSFNRRFVSMWGIPPKIIEAGSDERALGSVLEALADPEAFLKRVRDLYRNQRAFSRDEEIRLKDGRVFERNSAPIHGVNGSGYFGRVWYFRDITQRKKTEAALAVSQEKARIERDFISTVSHELRTPTAAILGFTETLLRGGLEDRQHRRSFTRAIHRHSLRLRNLIEDLLDLSSLDGGRRPPRADAIHLSRYLGPLLDAVSHVARRRGVTVRKRIAPGLMIAFDETHLHRVLTNLLDNAVKYNRRGGEVEVRARATQSRALLTVSDTGIGISEEELPRLFERFFRSKNPAVQRRPGNGLGLSMVKHLTETNGGAIRATSQLGQGTSFHLTLPLA